MDRPIIMKDAMVRAVLAGQKTQTRTPVKKQPPIGYDRVRVCARYAEFENDTPPLGKFSTKSPMGEAGDRLWVRETWDWRDWQSGQDGKIRIAYAADGEQVDRIAPPDWNPTIYNAERWRPSIHMPRWASRIALPLVSVRVERVQDISEADVWAEGYGEHWQKRVREAGADGPLGYPYARGWFAMLWNELYGTWAQNPWVWVAEWKEIEVVR